MKHIIKGRSNIYDTVYHKYTDYKKKVKYLKKQVKLNEAQLNYFEHKLKSWKQKYDYLIWVKNNSK